jgi:hypothetical protein
LNEIDKRIFEADFVFARNFNISRADLLDMSYVEAMYWLELLKRENLETNARMEAASRTRV